MSSRLLCRYARFLCTAAQAPAAAARLPAAVAGVQKVLAWPEVTQRLMCDRRTKVREENISGTPPRTKLDELLERATKPEDVLLAWEENGGNGNQAAIAIVKWALLVQREKGRFTPEQQEDPRLAHMMATTSAQAPSLWNSMLVSVLRSLWVMGICPQSPVLTSVQLEVLWRIRRLTFKQLALLAEWGANSKQQQDVAIVNAALKHLEMRWIEIPDAKTVTTLMSKVRQMTPTMMEKLEDKALELAESFSAEEIRRVCISLAAQRRRSVPLLRAMSYHLLQKPSSELTTPLILDMAYSYGILNFQHSQVFQRMAAELLPKIHELSSTDVMRCAKSLGFLKWLHIPLFEAFAEHFIDNSQTYSVFHVSNLLMTLARLGFQPSNGEEFYSKVHSVLEESISDLGPFMQADVVWSLCVLQQAKPHYILPFAQQEHITKIIGEDSSSTRAENYRLKLLHIFASLHLEHPNSSEAVLPPASLISVPVSKSALSPLKSSLREALHSLVDGRTEALRTGVHTLYGWTIDGELVVDYYNKPIDMLQFKAPHLPGGGGDQSLPVEARRLAVLGLEFPNFGSKSKDLLGRFVMMKRHLQLAGFITVEVPYYEWLELKTDWQKQAYLKDKMGKAVAEDMAK